MKATTNNKNRTANHEILEKQCENCEAFSLEFLQQMICCHSKEIEKLQMQWMLESGEKRSIFLPVQSSSVWQCQSNKITKSVWANFTECFEWIEIHF